LRGTAKYSVVIESWSDPCASAISELLSLIPCLHSQLLKPHSEPQSTPSKYMTSHPYDLTAIEQFLSSTSSSTEDRVMLQPHSNIEDTNGMSFSELFRLVYILIFTRDRGIKSREGQTSPFRKGSNPRGASDIGQTRPNTSTCQQSILVGSHQSRGSWQESKPLSFTPRNLIAPHSAETVHLAISLSAALLCGSS